MLKAQKITKRYSISFFVKEFFLFVTGYYSKYKNLALISWYIHIFLLISYLIIFISNFSANTLNQNILAQISDENTKSKFYDIEKFIADPNVNQHILFLFSIYNFCSKIFFFFFYLTISMLCLKIFLAFAIFRQEINLTNKCKWKVFFDFLWNPIFPIYSYYKLNNKKVFYLKKESKFSLTKFMNNIFRFHFFPKINQKELIKITNLNFLYHDDNNWDKYFHIFLKKFFPNAYKKHMIKNNILDKSEIAEKDISNIKALKNINLSILTSKFTTILGCNGSSKTTLIKAIVNLFSRYEGKICWINKDLKKISSKSFFKNISYIPQNWDKNIQITLYEFVSYGLFSDMPFFKFNFPKNHPKIIENLKKMNLYEYKDKNLNLLSGGEKQRAILARALIQETNVIILDEPTTYLDIKNQYLLLKLLKNLQINEKKTIITILHDLQQAKQFSDWIVLLNEGEVYATGKTDDVMNEKNINFLFK